MPLFHLRGKRPLSLHLFLSLNSFHYFTNSEMSYFTNFTFITLLVLEVVQAKPFARSVVCLWKQDGSIMPGPLPQLTECFLFCCFSFSHSIHWTQMPIHSITFSCFVFLVKFKGLEDGISQSVTYILFFFFLFVVDFVIHWNEIAKGLHVFPIPVHAPTSLSTRSL